MVGSESRGAPWGGRLIVVAILILGVSLATIATLGRPRVSIRPQSPQELPQLMLLPFESLNGEPDGERLAMDLTRGLTTRLETTTTGFDFLAAGELASRGEGVRLDVRKLAASSGVDYVLTGSVKLEPHGVTIDAFMVQAEREPRIWVQSEHWPAGAALEAITHQTVDKILKALTDVEGAPRERPKPYVP